MPTHHAQHTPHLALVRVVTWVLATLVGASTTLWVLQWPTPASSSTTTVTQNPQPAVDSRLVARLLGAQTQANAQANPTAALAGQFKLHGVIANDSGHGSALIAVNGKPAKPYPVGQEVAPGWVLQAVSLRTATLGASASGPSELTLDLPKPSQP